MRIKDIPQEERPKEKLMYAGAESLSTSELLALIIRTGNSSSPRFSWQKTYWPIPLRNWAACEKRMYRS